MTERKGPQDSPGFEPRIHGASDPVTSLFGAFGGESGGRESGSAAIDLALGALRGVSRVGGLWDDIAVDRLVDGLDTYPGTQGTRSLLEGFAALLSIERSCDVSPENFVATHGALDALGHAVGTLPDDGSVIFPEPGFGFGLAATRMRRRPVPVVWGLGDSVMTYVELVRDALHRIAGQAAVVASFPANPSGKTVSTMEWDALRSVAAEFDALVILDDVYRFAETSPAQLDFSGDDLIVVDSLSKRFGAPGLRLGYAMTTGSRLDQLRASMGMTSVGVGGPSAYLGLHAINRFCAEPKIRSEILDTLAQRRTVIRDLLPDGMADRVSLTDVGFYGCIELLSGEDSTTVAQTLRDRGVRVTPSSSLFTNDERVAHAPFLRFCLGSDPRIGEAFEIILDELLSDELDRVADSTTRT